MKRFYTLFVILLTLSSVMHIANADWSMPDANLKAAVIRSINEPQNHVLTEADMAKLDELKAAGKGITDLTGLEAASIAKKFRLASNSISDISALSGLTTLTLLRLQNNSITDISDLSGLTNLTDLDLSNNQITDCSPLTGLTNLTRLNITGNSLTNAHLLKPLKDGGTTIDITIPDPPDTTRPGVSITWPSDLTRSGIWGLRDGTDVASDAFNLTITFTEAVTGFEATDISTSFTEALDGDYSYYYDADEMGYTLGTLTTTDNITYTLTVTPKASTLGYISIEIPADIATDAANNQNTAAESKRVKLDTMQPISIIRYFTEEPTHIGLMNGPITDPKTWETNFHTTDGTFWIDILFLHDLQERWWLSEDTKERWTSRSRERVTTLKDSDLSLTNNTANASVKELKTKVHTSAYPDEMHAFLFKIEVTTAGVVTIELPKNVVQDPIGNPNTASRSLTITYTTFENWDVNEDGNVDITDMTLVLADIGKDTPTTARADVNKDGSVTVADLQLVIDNLDDPTNATAPAITDKSVVFNAERLQAELKRVGTDPRYAEAIAYIQQLLNIERPATTRLLANYPNPFNPETWIPYQLAKASNVQITIYDVRGTVVRSLKLGHKPEGYYTNRSRAAHWDGRNNFGERVATGVYFYQLQADSMSLLRKMVILK